MTAPAHSFDIIGSLDAPASPVVLSVPHAGRDYPLALRAALRVPLEALVVLEDRHVDAVARAESERDPRIDEGASASGRPIDSAKLRSGLGLVPRRGGRAGDLWRRRLTDAEVVARIRADHRPYHAALAQALAAARRRFGIAVLLDVHSMPPGHSDIVFGDRFGRAAAARFVHRIEAEAEAAGFAHALNTPYSGGHILDRHGDPARGIHAIQIEWSRALYLDAALDRPGPGLPRVAAALGAMIDALADEAAGGALPIAAQ
jgi:N-formylglutamate amidohydrolase